MKTLILEEAANFLKMTPEGLRKKVVNGEIPGAKPGKCWVFSEEDLVDYLRSLYPSTAKASWDVTQINKRTSWHSTKERTSDGLQLATKEREYKKLLGLPIK